MITLPGVITITADIRAIVWMAIRLGVSTGEDRGPNQIHKQLVSGTVGVDGGHGVA